MHVQIKGMQKRGDPCKSALSGSPATLHGLSNLPTLFFPFLLYHLNVTLRAVLASSDVDDRNVVLSDLCSPFTSYTSIFTSDCELITEDRKLPRHTRKAMR